MQKKETKNICFVSGKVCLSAREAGEIINNARKHYDHRSYNNSHNIPRRKYFCKDCGCFHVTHYLKAKNFKDRQVSETNFYRDYTGGKCYICA